MAQAKKQTKGTAAKKAPARPAAPAYDPSKRIIGGVICLFLSLFSFIGYANVDAWFITYFCGFIKGIVGWGYYLFPVALLICSIDLFLSRGRPVVFKVVSALLCPVFLGALYHLFVSDVLSFDAGTLTSLYGSGLKLASGGVIGGSAAIGLNAAVSIYGAVPVFIVGLAYFGMRSCGVTLRSLFRKSGKKRASRTQLVSAGSAPGAAAGTEKSARQSGALSAESPKRRGRHAAIDIPVDGEDDKKQASAEPAAERKVGFFNAKPRVKTPDQVLSQAMKTDAAPAAGNAAETKAAPARPAQSGIEAPDVKTGTATDRVEPLSVEEAAAVAGIAATVTEVLSENAKSAPQPAKKIKPEEVSAETDAISKTIEKQQEEEAGEYRYPPVSLLKTAPRNMMDGREEIALNRERLDSTIKSFGVAGNITGTTRGPTVTRYDIELDQGVKLAKLTNLAGDLALSLGVSSVRIAPIPDKISTVGIEVPNRIVSTVYLHDIIDSPAFRNAKSKLSFALGEDIGGNAIVGNIAKLPHLLIAGTTGSGKSVCMNSLILSLLYKSTPEEVRLIMIDPKMVELGIYNGIPHLYVPVVTDPKKAAGALQWSVVEMLKRYRLFSEIGVRDLAGYNAHQKSIGEQTMPRVVIVIDELADLMLVASKEVEESICRVAQMGRAAGMHLVIATQRPSADVITGLMKANIPSRIAFAVSSSLESRIILDNSGAEKLIGAGDMLYAPLGVGKPIRIQGAFVSDEEREKVIDFVKEGAEVEYSEEILSQIEQAASGEDKSSGGSSGGDGKPDNGFGADYDELLPQAVDVIFETKQASVSMLQRRLKLGYARAARIVDQMEELGVVGPFEGSKPRQVLITKEQWDEMRAASGIGPRTEQVSFAEYEDAPAEEWKD